MKNIFLSILIGILIFININTLNNPNQVLANGRVKSYITKNTDLYEISLGISPNPLQQGIGHIVVVIKDQYTKKFINDAKVIIQLNHKESSTKIGPLTLTDLSELEPLSLNEYDIDLVLSKTGKWDLHIEIQNTRGHSEFNHEIEVVKPNPIAAIFGILVFVLLSLILITSIYRQMKTKQQKTLKH